MGHENVHRTFDARGLVCPMPLVRARLELGKLEPGQVLKVIATDRGSVRDFQSWAKSTESIQLLAQETISESGRDVYVHYVKKVT